MPQNVNIFDMKGHIGSGKLGGIIETAQVIIKNLLRSLVNANRAFICTLNCPESVSLNLSVHV